MSAAAGVSRRASVPGDVLLQPVVIAAIAVLIINDHLLKQALPGFISGKLSDVAGLIFFPLLLVAAREVLGSRLTGRWSTSRVVLGLAILATGIVFVAIKVDPSATSLYARALGGLQWPFVAVGALFSDAGVPLPIAVRAVTDPTDLLALPALLVAWYLGTRGR